LILLKNKIYEFSKLYCEFFSINDEEMINFYNYSISDKFKDNIIFKLVKKNHNLYYIEITSNNSFIESKEIVAVNKNKLIDFAGQLNDIFNLDKKRVNFNFGNAYCFVNFDIIVTLTGKIKILVNYSKIESEVDKNYAIFYVYSELNNLNDFSNGIKSLLNDEIKIIRLHKHI
jgi:hypothetical protein